MLQQKSNLTQPRQHRSCLRSAAQPRGSGLVTCDSQLTVAPAIRCSLLDWDAVPLEPLFAGANACSGVYLLCSRLTIQQ